MTAMHHTGNISNNVDVFNSTVACTNYLKYFPVTFSILSSTAQYILVCAPSLVVLHRKIMKGHIILYPETYRNNSVITIPGCTELAVTPVPAEKTTL